MLALARPRRLPAFAARRQLLGDLGLVLAAGPRRALAASGGGAAFVAFERRGRRRFGPAPDEGRVEIGVCLLGEFDPELVAQNAGVDLGDRALFEFAEFERAERDADEAVDRQPEMFEHALDLAVLALAQTHRQPDVGALLALEPSLDASVMHALDRQAFAQGVELRLRRLAVRAHAVAAQPSRRRQFEHARESAVVGQQQQALGVDVEPADRDDAWQIGRQRVEYGRATFGVARGRHQPARLMEQEQARAFGLAQALAVDAHVVLVVDVISRARQHDAVDADAPRRDPGFGVAART